MDPGIVPEQLKGLTKVEKNVDFKGMSYNESL